MNWLGGADLSWQADYAQFYVVDTDHPDFNPPIDITRKMEERRWHQMETGLVVYTDGALNQVIEVRLFSAEPKADPIEYRSGMAWQQTEVAQARFFCRQTSPCPLRHGPIRKAKAHVFDGYPATSRFVFNGTSTRAPSIR